MVNLTNTWAGYCALISFLLAFSLVIFEEKIRLKKSKPVVLIGCLMWLFIGIYEEQHGGGKARFYVKELIGEIGELFFFLLSAMTYINTLDERNAFKSLRAWLLRKGLSFRQLFWATGALAFFISPVADNLTTALLMSTVAQAIGGGNARFIVPTFTSIVIAANAGGAWSPFGDITTLMVWTAGKVSTTAFGYLFVPAVVNWVVPALFMSFYIPNEKPEGVSEKISLKPGAKMIMILGGLTIVIAVVFHQFLHLPPYLGMMLGFGLLMMMGYYLNKVEEGGKQAGEEMSGSIEPFDIFTNIKEVEFDTLFFFFGILTAVGALQYVGYLVLVGEGLYKTLGPTTSNILAGLLSAVVDNIPLMFAVLKMDPAMGLDQWLLVTFSTGVGGSLLSIGSAAGVAVMGVGRTNYTFASHLKWSPEILVGYIASILSWWLVTGSLR